MSLTVLKYIIKGLTSTNSTYWIFYNYGSCHGTTKTELSGTFLYLNGTFLLKLTQKYDGTFSLF